MCVRDSTRFWCVYTMYRYICIQLSRWPIYCCSKTRGWTSVPSCWWCWWWQGVWKKRSHSFKNNVDEWERVGGRTLLSSWVSPSPHPPSHLTSHQPAHQEIYTSPLNRKRNAWVFLSTFGRHRHLHRSCMRRNSCFILVSLTKLHRSHHNRVMDSNAPVLPPLLPPPPRHLIVSVLSEIFHETVSSPDFAATTTSTTYPNSHVALVYYTPPLPHSSSTPHRAPLPIIMRAACTRGV